MNGSTGDEDRWWKNVHQLHHSSSTVAVLDVDWPSVKNYKIHVTSI